MSRIIFAALSRVGITFIWAASITLPHFPLYADNLRDGHAFCQAQQAEGTPFCHLQPCPCGPGDTTLKRFEDPSASPPLCACRSPQEIRHQTRLKAVKVCNEYRREKQKSCFISSGDCPGGFEVLADFSDENGNRFTACRDGRHERPEPASSGLHGMSQEQIEEQYDELIEHLESQSVGQPQKLPRGTVERLGIHFHSLSLDSLLLIRTRTLSQGCFSDCGRIFCSVEGPIALWTDIDAPRISRYLLHQIAHAEDCKRIGARARFVDKWFRHLPDDIYQKLRAGEPIDARRIHFAMYMESHANHRAESICRQLPDCRMEPPADQWP